MTGEPRRKVQWQKAERNDEWEGNESGQRNENENGKKGWPKSSWEKETQSREIAFRRSGNDNTAAKLKRMIVEYYYVISRNYYNDESRGIVQRTLHSHVACDLLTSKGLRSPGSCAEQFPATFA